MHADMMKFALISLVVAVGRGIGSATSQSPLSKGFVCEHPPYTVQMVSKSPLVLYINNFITQKEREHLQLITFVTLPSLAEALH